MGVEMVYISVHKKGVILLLLCLVNLCCCISIKQRETKIYDGILNGYDKRVRPDGLNETDGPTVVTANMYLRSFEDVNDVKMEYRVQITLRQKWNDPRLKYHHKLTKAESEKIKFLTSTSSADIWTPDTFFRNKKDGRSHHILAPNLYVRIFPNGDVLYSVRLTLTLFCPMDLRLYPFDSQECRLQLASYAWHNAYIDYNWKSSDPVQVTRSLHLPRFSLRKFKSGHCDVLTSTGHYSCIEASFFLQRESSYYIMTIYVPSVMLVTVSWLSFWLDPSQVLAKLFMGVSTLLTMSVQTASINRSLPPVAYTKAIDTWTGVCVMFLFVALVQSVAVHFFSITKAKFLGKCQSIGANVDVLSRVMFPVSFVLFNIIYWAYYASQVEDAVCKPGETCHQLF